MDLKLLNQSISNAVNEKYITKTALFDKMINVIKHGN